MYTFCIVMIIIASILLILAVLVQSPKSGMAANFGAANQTMGVRQTTDFLEKFTWAMVAGIVFFTLLSVISLPEANTQQAVIGTEEISEALTESTKVVDETITVGEDGLVIEADAEAATAEETPAEQAE
ncbi:MAG: preprotein translocase subunit SecG [Alistipes sp.]|nr:preprotein translocase subunit SecG [Alistipes sp.]MEE1149094.1 preprotein translocase subunit SecG [Alistipes sp.]